MKLVYNIRLRVVFKGRKMENNNYQEQLFKIYEDTLKELNLTLDQISENEKDIARLFIEKVIKANLLQKITCHQLINLYGILDTHKEKHTELSKEIELRIFNNDFDNYISSLPVSENRIFSSNILNLYRKILLEKLDNDNYSSNQKSILKKKLSSVESLLNKYNYNNENEYVSQNDKADFNISYKYRELENIVNDLEISKETLKESENYSFFDTDGNKIPQFIDEKGKKTFDSSKYLDREGRFYNIIQTVKNKIIRDNLYKDIDKDYLRKELNQSIILELYKLKNVSLLSSKESLGELNKGIVKYNKAKEPVILDIDSVQNYSDIQAVTNKVIAKTGGDISDDVYESAIDNAIDDTANDIKLLQQGNTPEDISEIAEKQFDSINDTGNKKRDSKRNVRKLFLLKMLKGIASAFLVSFALTIIATAGAAVAGVSVAVAMATIGITAGIVTSTIQIQKWRKQRKADGEDASLNSLLKDKKMLTKLGTTGLAAVAMIFGAAGLSQAAGIFGFSALSLGGTSSSVSMYKDARNVGMTKEEAIVWSIANAGAILLSGLAGRATAGAAIDAINQNNPENEVFQDKSIVMQEKHTTVDVYDDKAIHNAEKICKMWYRDNPAELQHRVDMINDYNSSHGTNINPYRAIMISADAGGRTFDNMALHVDGGGVKYSGGNHNVINTEQWRQDYGFTKSDIDSVKHLFNGKSINPDAIDTLQRLDRMVSINNEVGKVSSGDAPHYDGVLHRNTVDRAGNPVYNTYAGGKSAFVQQDIITNEETIVFTPLKEGKVAMFGVGMRKVKGLDLRKLIKYLEVEIKDLQEKIKSCKDPEEKKELQDRINIFIKIIDYLKDQMSYFKQLKNRINGKSKPNLDEFLRNVSEEKENILKRIEFLTKNFQSLLKDVKSLEKELEDSKDPKDIIEIKKEIEELKNQTNNFSKEINLLKTRIDNLSEVIEYLNEQKSKELAKNKSKSRR